MWSRSSGVSFLEEGPGLPFLGFVIGALASLVLWGVMAWALWAVKF
jgi:hypothetical protein